MREEELIGGLREELACRVEVKPMVERVRARVLINDALFDCGLDVVFFFGGI